MSVDFELKYSKQAGDELSQAQEASKFFFTFSFQGYISKLSLVPA